MNGVIEAKPARIVSIRVGTGADDQASALRAMMGRRDEHRAMRRGAAADPRAGGVLRIAWLVERECPALRASIARIAASTGRHGPRVVWETGVGGAISQGRTDGLLVVCDSCAGVAEALRRVRLAVAEGGRSLARSEASVGWIGAIGLTAEPAERCAVSVALRGLRDTAERLMDEPVQLLGVHRLPRWRGWWPTRSSRSRNSAVSDELCQEIERFLDSQAQSSCAIR